MTNGRRMMWGILPLMTAALLCTTSPTRALEPTGNDIPLASVNGDPVTSGELDRLLISTHRSMDSSKRGQFDYRRLLDKLIHDRLIYHEAESMGIGDEVAFREAMAEDLLERAVSRFVSQEFQRPSEIPEADIERRFEEYYWKIQLRQLSLRTEREITTALEEIRAGASMEQMALETSLDTKKLRGGLHNLLHWADVTVLMREASEDLEVGEVSEPFPLNDAFSIVRVEQRVPADNTEYPQFRSSVEAWLLKEAEAEAWNNFVVDLERRYPVSVDSEALRSIEADSMIVLDGAFLKASDHPALTVDGLEPVTEGELRREISHQAMNDGLAQFQSLVQRGVNKKKQSLVLKRAAKEAGYLSDSEVLARHEEHKRNALIEVYLGEIIAPQIKFRREEFEAYYESNADEFRHPDQVLLGTLVLEDEPTAIEAYDRLQGGADFEYLRNQYSAHGTAEAETPKWVTLGIFSPEIAEELSTLEPGQASRPFEVPNGWMIFKLKGARKGAVKPMEEVDLKIREVMFQRKFSELMDTHLALLRERSNVQEFPEAIEAYFQGEDAEDSKQAESDTGEAMPAKAEPKTTSSQR